MAQNFRRYTSNAVGTAATTVFTANSFDTIIGIALANVNATTSINATVTINDGTNDIDLVKNAPIPVGSQLQVIDGGAKYVVQSGDVLKVNCDVASAMDVWVSAVDDIST